MNDAIELRRVLEYDPETGLFTNRVDRRGNARAGMVAGSPDKGGYLQIFFAGKNHKAHRLAWLYMTGSWPSSNIDHINGVPWDNRWANLRDTPQSVNAQNLRRPRRDNKTGFLGVSPDRRRGGFIAQISANGRCRYLGRFPTPELAHQAYVQAKRQLHAGCTI